MDKIVIGVDPHKLSDDRGRRPSRESAGVGPVRHRQGRLRRDAQARGCLAGSDVRGRGQQRRRQVAGAATAVRWRAGGRRARGHWLQADGTARVGPIVAARVQADVGDVTRFADMNRFASWTGTAPIEASSGETVRHRLSRAGNRRMNHMIHIAAATQIRLDTEGRAYSRRKLAAGNTRMEAMRCLKRRISDALYRQLLADTNPVETGAGGHCGRL